MPIDSNPKKAWKSIKELYLLMQLSRKAYAKYLQHKIYLHALCIRSSNKKIYCHLLENLATLPEEIENEALDLLNHYDIWMKQFKDFKAIQKPALGDEFVFHHLDDLSAFPKAAEQKIFDYYLLLKSQKN